MKTKTVVVVLAVIALAGRTWADPDNTSQTSQQLRLELDLSDGSHIIGVPVIASVSVQTPYATMKLPLKQVLALKMGEDHEAVTIDMRNGDKLKGVIHLEPISLETLFGNVAIGVEHIRALRVALTGGALLAGEGPLAFGGVNWLPWRTLFEVQGDKLVSLPKVRPGFSYGHGGNGRGPGLMTNIGNPDWRDYSVEFEFCMSGVDPALNPYGLPPDYHGGGIAFHVVDAKESWNECGGSGYNLSLSGDGAWSLGCSYNWYCRVPTGYGNPQSDGERKLAEGKGLKLDPQTGNKIRIDVCGTRIQIRVDGEKIVDVRDEKMLDSVGEKTLDHGGIGVGGCHDCMIWIRNFSAKRL